MFLRQLHNYHCHKNGLYHVVGYLHCIGQDLDFYSSKYNDFIVLDDFNSKIVNNFIENAADKFILKFS